MPQTRRAGRAGGVRRVPRSRSVVNQPPEGPAPAPSSPPVVPVAASTPAGETARRIAEAVLIAAVSSASFYLVGSVYTDAYYSRLAIEVTSLDLAPSYVALQAIHALWGLLEYPLILLLFYLIYQMLLAPGRRLSDMVVRAERRLPRLVVVFTNLLVVTPLLVDDFLASFRERELAHRSVLTELTSVLRIAGLILLAYVIWVGWSQRRYLLAELRARKGVPIALVFTVYLLGALVSTAVVAELAANERLTGTSDGSLRVTFLRQPDVLPELDGKELILVTSRNSAYYVVVRESLPPSQRPTSYVIPFAAVEAAEVTRFR